MTKLDLQRLRADVDRRTEEQPRSMIRSTRPLTGSMQIIRDNLKAILDLKAGSTWAIVAAGLAEQGVTQGQGAPITAKRLTALIASIRRVDAGREASALAKANRTDLAPVPGRLEASPNQLRLSSDLAVEPRVPDEATVPTEESFRRKALERAQILLKKKADPS